MKKCAKCNNIKNINEFNKFVHGFKGLRSRCKQCERQYDKNRRLKNGFKEKINYKNNIYRKNKRINDVNYKIYINFRSRIKNYLRGFTNYFKTKELLGFSIDHIIPLSLFPTTIEGVKLANQLINLRLIECKENSRKRDEIDIELIKYFNLEDLYNSVKQ